MALIEINDDLKTIQKFDELGNLIQKETYKEFIDDAGDDTAEVQTLLMRLERYIDSILIQEKEWTITDLEEDVHVETVEGKRVELALDLDSFITFKEDIGSARVLDFVKIYRKIDGTLLQWMIFDTDGNHKVTNSFDTEGNFVGSTIYNYNGAQKVSGGTSFFKDGTVFALSLINVETSIVTDFIEYEYDESFDITQLPEDLQDQFDPEDFGKLPAPARSKVISDRLTPVRINRFNLPGGDEDPVLTDYTEFEYDEREKTFTIIDRMNLFTKQMRDARDNLKFVPDRNLIRRLISLHSIWWQTNWDILVDSFKVSTDDTKRIVRQKTFNGSNELIRDIEGFNVLSSDVWENPENWFKKQGTIDFVNRVTSDNNHPTLFIVLSKLLEPKSPDPGEQILAVEPDSTLEFTEILTLIEKEDVLKIHLDEAARASIPGDNWTVASQYIHDLSYIHPMKRTEFTNEGFLSDIKVYNLKRETIQRTIFTYLSDQGTDFSKRDYEPGDRLLEESDFVNNILDSGLVSNYDEENDRERQTDIYDNALKQHVGFNGYIYDEKGVHIQTIEFRKMLNETTQIYGDTNQEISLLNETDQTSVKVFKEKNVSGQFVQTSMVFTDKIVFFNNTGDIESVSRSDSAGAPESVTIFEYDSDGNLVKSITSSIINGVSTPIYEETFDSQGRLLTITDLVSNKQEVRDYYT